MNDSFEISLRHRWTEITGEITNYLCDIKLKLLSTDSFWLWHVRHVTDGNKFVCWGLHSFTLFFTMLDFTDFINQYQPSVVFHIEASHLIWFTVQIKLLVSILNATLGWYGLIYLNCSLLSQCFLVFCSRNIGMLWFTLLNEQFVGILPTKCLSDESVWPFCGIGACWVCVQSSYM